ncbi:glycosyltransferase family 2 protein [Candidatus Sumerlaeota bacterium]|nr:glycosyltransferase family 2 protein [Candidatus Sumerlaeota bacterium]
MTASGEESLEPAQSDTRASSGSQPSAPPLVSIGIVCWNDRRFLPKCLGGVFSQTYRALEVILIDNGSTDGSVEEAERAFPQLRIVRNSENLGFTRAQNKGIRLSTGKYYVPLNSDVTLEPEFVSEAVAALEKRPDFGYASGLVYFDTDDPECRNVVYSAGHLLVRNGLAYNRHYLRQVPREALEEGETGGANGACPVYRREMLEDIAFEGEYFDEDFFLYWEDVDIDWRAHLAGWRCWFTPRAVSHHYMEGSGLARTARGRARVAVNRWLMLIKDIEFSLFLRHFLYIVKLDLTRTLPILLEKPSSFLQLHKGLLGNVVRSLRKRRAIQSRRKWSTRQILEWQEESRAELNRTKNAEGATFTRKDDRVRRGPESAS